MERLLLIVKESETGTRLDRLIKRYHPFLSQGSIEKSLKNNLIKLDDKKVKSNIRVIEGQSISIANVIIQENKAPKAIKKINENILKDFRKTIIFEDQNIIAINKPSGLATQGGSKINISVDDIIQYEYNEARLVHRLDRDTSGLLIIAKNIESANILTKYFREKNITKKYLALTLGRPHELQGIIDIPISKIKSDNFERMQESSNGQKATTHYKVIDYMSNQLSLIQFMPITGRTHQIRIHAKLMDMPIVGDKKYGYYDDNLNIDHNFLHLHSWQIEIENMLGKNYSFLAPLPKYILGSMNEYGLKLS